MTVLLSLAALCALLAIAAEERARGRHRAFYVLKPLTTLLVLGAAAAAPAADPDYRSLIELALVLSAAGDVALLFEGTAAFVAGLSAFLVAHGVFVAAFFVGTGWAIPSMWSIPPAIAGAAFFARLLPRTGTLMPAVAVYGVALLAMMLVASARWNVRADASGLLVFAGATIFVASDSALAVRKFFGPYRGAQALILSTYWLAVGAIAASVAYSAAG